MKSPELRPARKGEIEAFTGKPLEHSMRAIVADLDGEILGWGGLVYSRGRIASAVMDMKPLGARYPVTAHRAGKMVMKMAERLGLEEVAAIREKKYPNSEKWLRLLGFELALETSDGEIWIWRRQSRS